MATVQDETYYPWGQRWSNIGAVQDERFPSLGARDGETGLDPTDFRMYHSRLYRWLSPDPLAGDITNPQSLNRYAYALNNPATVTDPLGPFIGRVVEKNRLDSAGRRHRDTSQVRRVNARQSRNSGCANWTTLP